MPGHIPRATQIKVASGLQTGYSSLSSPSLPIVQFAATASRGRRTRNTASLSAAVGCQPVLVSFGLRAGWYAARMAELL